MTSDGAMCAMCDKWRPRWWARNPHRPQDGRWLVCDSCRRQGSRLRASVVYEALPAD